MLNERPEGKDKFGYVLIGLLVAFVIILVTSAVIWNSNHPEKVQENFEKIDTQQAEEKKGAKLVKQMQKMREAFYKRYSGGKWKMTSGKDIVVNRAKLGREGCVEVIASAYRYKLRELGVCEEAVARAAAEAEGAPAAPETAE